MAEPMGDLLGQEEEASNIVTADKELQDQQALYRRMLGR